MNRAFLQRFLAGVLIIIMGFSATPKIVFHWLISKHEESSAPINDIHKAHLTYQGFTCKYGNLVVESPFIFGFSHISFHIPVSYHTMPVPVNCKVYSAGQRISRLRGPPCMFS